MPAEALAEQAQEDREDLAERARKNRESDLLRRIPFLRFFDYGHLPEYLQKVVPPFRALAYEIANHGVDPAERQAALRKLCESKDCAVRALIPIEPE